VTEAEFLRTTRASYDAVAEDYAGRFRDELDARPLDRAVLAGSAELVRAADLGPVADIGCGTSRVTAHLNDLGVPIFGIDPVQVRRRLDAGAGPARRRSRWQPDAVAGLLGQAGLQVQARVLREPDTDGDFPERTPQAFLLARKPAGPATLA
jgi:SAM-dependent methyltransferase